MFHRPELDYTLLNNVEGALKPAEQVALLDQKDFYLLGCSTVLILGLKQKVLVSFLAGDVLGVDDLLCGLVEDLKKISPQLLLEG